ncbi:MAG: hypothetical protein WBJ10_03825 [Daejeonella sp.]|uniref:hypothetical protein n=1 Tax=Daejeonella sp. TaxID=2805397 RepID=UPI003C72179D
MKNTFKSVLIANLVLVLGFTSCKKDSPVDPVTAPENLVLSGEIKTSLSLKENSTYTLKGRVTVLNNSVLTIPAGTQVLVESAASASEKGALIITKGSTININGTKDKPVVFTSAASVKAPGDWIGIIVMGKAKTNGTGGMLNLAGHTANTNTQFGGTEDTDNSGSIKFLRIEYAGGLNPAQEEEWEVDMTSGLSLNGVGSGTTIENVMVKHSRDDAFQFVGGKVNAKYLIAYDNGDDNFDFDRGYTGKLQFVISYNPNASTVAIRAHGMESLNDKDATEAMPYTRPIISNMPIIGPQVTDTDVTRLSQGIYIRKNTRFNVQNSIIAGYSNGGLMLCPKTRPLLVNNQGSEFKFNLVNADTQTRSFTYDNGPSGIVIVPDPEVASIAIQQAAFQTQSLNRNKVVSNTELQLKGLYASTPDLSLVAGSQALTAANLSGSDFTTFFTAASHIGAVGTDNWAAAGAWVNWQ